MQFFPDGRTRVRDHGYHGRVRGLLQAPQDLARSLHRSCRGVLFLGSPHLRYTGKTVCWNKKGDHDAARVMVQWLTFYWANPAAGTAGGPISSGLSTLHTGHHVKTYSVRGISLHKCISALGIYKCMFVCAIHRLVVQ